MTRAALPLLALLLLAPLVDAHGANAPDAPFTRLLADVNDDCGGDSGAATGACRGSHDLIALDIQEKWGGSEAVVIRFWLDKGKTYPIVDTFTFNGPSGGKTLAIKTTDDSSFSVVTGFESVSAAHSLNDGSRFWVDGTVKLDTLGLKVGDQVANFKVESKAGNNIGDFMPGGCHNTIGDCAVMDTSTVYTKTNYDLKGTDYYAKLEPPQTIQVQAGSQPQTIQIQLSNLLTVAQSVTIKVSGMSGIEAGMHSGAFMDDATPPASMTIDVPGKGGSSLHLRVRGIDGGATGTLILTLDTDQGGHLERQIPYTVTTAEATQQTSDTAQEPAKGSPAPAAAQLFLALAGMAWLRRK